MPAAGSEGEEGLAGEQPGPGTPKLCGYLQKLSGKGPLRGFRSRWFVFDPRRCYLYYFKGPQEPLPLGHLDIASACFSYHQPEAGAAAAGDEPTAFEVHSPGGAVTVLRAATRQDTTYWLQELQQKRWEYCNNLDAAKRDSRTSPTPSDFSKGLVAKDSPDLSILSQNASAERARNILAVETSPTDLVGEQAASQPAPAQGSAINFSLKQWSTEIKNSMSSLRKGSNDNRRSIFYTTEEWELLDPTPKDLEDSMALEEKRKHLAEGSKGLPSSAFPFDFGRIPHKARRPLRDVIGSSRNRNSSDSSPTEWCSGNGNRLVSELQLKYHSQQEELEKLKKDLLSQKELVRLLQQTVRSSQYDKYFASRLCEGVSKDTLELLHQKDDQILGLNNQLEKLSLEKDSLQQEVKNLKCKVGELNERLGMLMETIQAKDEVIMKLSRQLSECEDSTSSQSGATNSPMATCTNKELQELDRLKYTSLEAKLCQIESKYLILLQEMKTPVCSEDQSPAREVITQLLEDALKAEPNEQPEQAFFKPHLVSEYDIYGFQTIPEDDDEEKLVAKSRALDLRSLSLSENREISTGVKWENYLASTMNREMMRCVELKNLIRSGIPHEHRSKMWKWCVNLHVKKFKDSAVPGYFQILLLKALEKPNPASKQIELDLLRTLPNNKHYSSPTSEGIQKLRNVLLAFSWRNPDIGYCQGLNRLVAIALLYLEQEDAFWCLVTIVEVFMPRDYYTKTLLGSQVDQRVFKDLLSEKLPRLHAHFEQYKVDYTLITFNWFLVVFVDSVVSDILFKIWDSFLYEGPKVIFRFALALFKYKEEEILKLQDSMSIFKYLRYFTRTILDARKLTAIAFGDLNPFPLRQIRNRRAYHLEKVRLELTELEAIREDFLRERETCVEKRDLISDDEEDS
ncbi:TBC1 domain family member 2B isoform X3 [Haemorhous mexicanus]|uniref:TBC1 domain family member 2B isoform X3 n=1 Tax=Haemorhous mexicanus TaxID=30427 RepID=UPI0028BEBE50|nr:TBC1 domain family member 2B isoform X3 [Haemorhous mexicanus]